MIDAPPALTVKRTIQRPDPAVVAAFTGTPSSFVADAMNGRGALDFDIQPLAVSDRQMNSVVGPALTCYCGPADNLALFAAVARAQPGDVLVAGTDRFEGTCVTGDLLLGMAKNRGVAGLVTDGLVRDLEEVLAVGLPVFCRGVIPNSPARMGPGTVGLNVTLGRVAVAAGDLIVADRDGVVVVPQAQISDVLQRLVEIRAAEAKMDAAVKDGLEIPDDIRALLDSDRVRYVD
jgi:4-hydroxy-4-methyl-2-oxoglutarate aldolase